MSDLSDKAVGGSTLLPLPGDNEGRVVCPECLKRYRSDKSRAWLFERYSDPSGKQVEAAEQFEVRKEGEVVQWREYTPERPSWKSYPGWLLFPGGTVFCVQCLPLFRTFDPQTGREVDL